MISFQKCCDFNRHQKCDKCLSLVSLLVFCLTDALVFDFAERCGAERSRYVDRLLALFAVLCFVSRQAVCPVPVPSELSPAQFTLFATLRFVSRQAVCPVPVPSELSPAQFTFVCCFGLCRPAGSLSYPCELSPAQFFPTVLANITNGHASVGELFRPDINYYGRLTMTFL